MTIIIQNVVRIIVPFILVFGAYVTVYGHISPGGGFAGGTILAAALILDRFVGVKEILLDQEIHLNVFHTALSVMAF